MSSNTPSENSSPNIADTQVFFCDTTYIVHCINRIFIVSYK